METNSIPLLERQFRLTDKKYIHYEKMLKNCFDPFTRNQVQFWYYERLRVMRILGESYNLLMGT